MNSRTLLGLFRDRSGSSTITVILSLVLALAMMASCLQWYWVTTSSMEIQTVADMGALAAGEVIAQTVMAIQILDAFMLTLNLFGLLLHCIVLVVGLFIVVAGPYGGEAAAEVYDKLIQFDRDYCERRREIADEVKVIAETICAAAPLLAYTRGTVAVQQNQTHLGADSQSSFQAIIIPAPVIGTLEMTNDPADLEAFEDEMRQSSAQNTESARKVKELEDTLEAAIDECFRLDIYKSAGTARAFWHPSYALKDFRAEWGRIAQAPAPAPVDPVPIDDTESTRAQAAQRYLDYRRTLIERIDSQVNHAIGPDPIGDTPMTPTTLSVSALTATEWNETVLILDHSAGERKAYHRRADCFGLSNASEQLRPMQLGTLRNQDDHPPCTWCAPPSWKALQVVEDDITGFIAAWNLEAEAILLYESLRAQIAEEVSGTQERTAKMLTELVEKAGAFLLGSRLIYEPSGGRGLWCVVVNTASRTLPEYTLPSLTGADGVELGPQVAVAGVRLLPSTTETTLPTFLRGMDVQNATSSGLGGVVRSIMGDDAIVVSFALGLWGSCLDLYGMQVGDLYRYSEGLPWGLGPLVNQTMDTVFEAAQITAPDMRRPVPTLVSVTDVGKAEGDGTEAALVATFGGGRAVLEQSGGLSTFGLKEQIRGAVGEMIDAQVERFDVLLNPTILGIPLQLPFLDSLNDSLGNLSDYGIELLYTVPDFTW